MSTKNEASSSPATEADTEPATEPGVYVMKDLITDWPARALACLLPGPAPELQHHVPPMWHWLYLRDRPEQTDLGPDGHPVRGSVQSSPDPGRRRMWAGGRVEILTPLLLGHHAERRSKITAERTSQGRAGSLLIRTIQHEIVQSGRVSIREEQDVIYLPAARPADDLSNERPHQPSPDDRTPGRNWEVDVSPSFLFRFSALTYNAHRIHYDREYAQVAEGYPGLLVHGPLQALLMVEHARRTVGLPAAGVHFDYRLTSPLFDHQGCLVQVEDIATTPEGLRAGQPHSVPASVTDRTGRVTARGTLTFAS